MIGETLCIKVNILCLTLQLLNQDNSTDEESHEIVLSCEDAKKTRPCNLNYNENKSKSEKKSKYINFFYFQIE